MSHIAIFVEGINLSGTDLTVNGSARVNVESSGAIDWSTTIAFTALASTMNSAIKDAAIAAAEVAGHSIGALDKKTIFGGAVGL